MSKLDMLRTCVFSTALYACKTWVVTAEIQIILAFEGVLLQKSFKNRMETFRPFSKQSPAQSH